MKNLLPILFIIFTISLFTNCQSDSQTAKKPKTEQRKKTNKNKKKKANQKKANKKKKAKPKPLPPLNKLKKSDKQTRALVKVINDKNLFKAKQPIRITEETIKITGAAIDKAKNTRAAGVYVKIGKQTFKAKYGLPDKAFAKTMKNQKFLKSGFTITIPKAKIKRGDYDVNLCVVSSDRKTYYEQKDKVKIKIR